MLKKRNLGCVDVALGQQLNLLRRSGYNAKSGLATWYFDRGMGFEITISKEGGTSRDHKIKQQEAARQSSENKCESLKIHDLTLSKWCVFSSPAVFETKSEALINCSLLARGT